MTQAEVLRPAEFARRAGVETRFVVQAMYEQRVPRIRLDDGTLGVPESGLDAFELQDT